MFIKIDNLNFEYTEGMPVLKNISFEVSKGEVLVIVGSSGSGKSTLLRLIADILKTNSNTQISIDNKSPEQYLQHKKLSFMFQNANLFPNRTVQENISLPCQIVNEKYEERVSYLMQVVGLTPSQHLLPYQLSGGMQTRTSLARSFITNPELLLLDEPFSALDIAWKDALYIELRKLVTQYGTTTILVTHDIEEAFELGDRVICLGVNGSIIGEYETRLHDKEIVKDLIINDHQLRKIHEKNFDVSAH